MDGVPGVGGLFHSEVCDQTEEGKWEVEEDEGHNGEDETEEIGGTDSCAETLSPVLVVSLTT